MSDREDPSSEEEPRTDGPVTEGVRIIGAQSAGDSARPSEDRPDGSGRRSRPAPDPDLPMVRISSTDADASTPTTPSADRFGAVPVVRPGSPPPEDARDSATSGGHARLLGPDEIDEPVADDDGFVLPHWTEPPTGQVPKVVIGDEQAEVEATPASGPRWRDEGERSGQTDFDDLVDDTPQLGSLDESDAVPDDFFAQAPMVDPDFVDMETSNADVSDAGLLDEAEFSDDLPDTQETGVGDSDESDAETSNSERGARRPAAQKRGSNGGSGSSSSDRNLPVAAAVGVGLIAFGLVCFKVGAFTTLLLVIAVVSLCALEYFSAVRARHHNPATLLGIAAVVGLLVGTYFFGLAAYPVVMALTTISGLLWYLWVAPGERGMQNLGLTFLGVLWIGFLGSFATLFLGLGRHAQSLDSSLTSNPGIGVLIAAVIVSVAHDVGAYFIGKQFGKTPMSAASPNKTQEGLAGGVVVALVTTTVIVGFFGIAPIGSSKAQTFVFALLCALVAPLGDLCESFVKRDLKIKDMGSVLPGHGGVLDRFDSLLFVLPTAYLVTVLFNVWS